MRTRRRLLGAIVSGTVVTLVVAVGLSSASGQGQSNRRQSFDVMIGGGGVVSIRRTFPREILDPAKRSPRS